MLLTQGHAGQIDAPLVVSPYGELLARMLVVMPCGAALFDPEQRLIDANQRWRDLLGQHQESRPEQRFSDLVAAGDAGRLHDFLSANEVETTREIQLQGTGGTPLRMEIRFQRLMPPDLEPSRWPVLACALEARTPAYGATRQETMARRLEIEHNPGFARVASWEWDVVTGRLKVSRAWYDIWGLDPSEEITEAGIRDQLLPEDREPLTAALHQACEQGVPFRVRHRIRRPDGSLRWVECLCRPEPGRADARRSLKGVLIDLSHPRLDDRAVAHVQDILAASPDRIALLDRDCRLQAANPAFLDAIHATEDAVIGRALSEVPEAGPLSELVHRRFRRCLDAGEIATEDIQEIDRMGGPREHEVKLFPHRDARDRVIGAVLHLRDVTEARESERHLLQSAAIYSATSDAVLITDATGQIVAVNDAFTRLTGYAKSEVIGQHPRLLNSHWHTKAFLIRMVRQLIRNGAWEGEIWSRRKDGEIVLQRLNLRRIKDARGKITNVVGIFSSRRGSVESHSSGDDFVLYDPLTRLPNRVLLASKLAHAIDSARPDSTPVAFVLLGLDRFAHVNSSLGHRIGDELLRTVGQRLRETIRAVDILGRWGGDQFGLILADIDRPSKIEEIAARLRAALRAPIRVLGHQLFLTASIGIALGQGPDNDVERMIHHAETALDLAKQAGRDGFTVHGGQPSDAQSERARQIKRLRTGLTNGECRLYLQPRVALATGTWAIAEAQLRWIHPELGLIASERLAPLAESGEMIEEIGHWIITGACRQVRRWIDGGMPAPGISIRISESLLTRIELVAVLEQAIVASGIQGQYLELELPESVFFKHPEQTRELIDGVHPLGVGLTLSEVGMSWLAPAALRRLSFSKLKIHPSLIAAMIESPDDLAIVQALVSMGQALDLEIIAAGVRTDDERQILLNIGCSEAQGELFAPPLPSSRFDRGLLKAAIEQSTRAHP